MPRQMNKNSWNGGHGQIALDKLEDKRHVGADGRVVLRMDSNRHRVSFKSEARPRWGPIRNLSDTARMYLNDDITMRVGPDRNTRQVVVRGRMGRGNLARGRNSPFPQQRYKEGQVPASRPSIFNEPNWFRVTIPYGHKYEKDYVIKSLLAHMAPNTFIPIMYKIFGTEAVFYVDDCKSAAKLAQCHGKITAKNGFKIQVRVRPGMPRVDIDPTLKEKMKGAMAKRFNPAMNALDLSSFHQDPDLVTDYFCTLSRPTTLMAVLEIVAECIPTLCALNLDNNKLTIIERLHVLPVKFPNLKILHIGNNRIREMKQLDVLKDVKLEELRLMGNPVCNGYKDRQSQYISDLREKFPGLLRVDGIELPKPISFDVADEGTKIPPSRRLCIVNETASDVFKQFLQQYFLVFDSEDRQPLLAAYHEQALFSMTSTVRIVNTKFSNYLFDERNLLRWDGLEKRRKLLKQGRLPVVSFITQIPKTQHDLNSFTMDVGLVTESMMLITVTGLFREVTEKKSLRYFNRTLIIVPQGSGFCIRSEQLHIADPTHEQERRAFAVEPTTTQAPHTQVQTDSATATSSQSILSDEAKREMTLELCRLTNMNLEWSLKCLNEVQWNFENALSAFQEFFKLGQIPAEAFAK